MYHVIDLPGAFGIFLLMRLILSVPHVLQLAVADGDILHDASIKPTDLCYHSAQYSI